jgi:peptide/nickel transport system substrate-binding protein
LVRWEPGTYLEGEAFDHHALGRPKIDRVIVLPVGDENTTLSNLLAGEVHLASRLSIRFEHGLVLRREWGSTKGTIFLESNPTVHAAFQFRPDSLKTPALLDVRVRKALAHSVDKEDLNQGLFEGEGIIGHSFTSPEQSYYGEVDRAVTKYPYDPRRTEQLMVEAGFARDRTGLFADASGQRFQPDFWVTAGPLFEKQLAIMTDTWQRAGIDVQPWAIPVAMTRDNSTRMLYPGILSHGVSTSERDALLNMTTEAIGTPANRFTGTNRGGWSNPEYDRLWGVYSSTLDRSERTRYVIEIMKLRAEQLPSIMLFFNYSVVAHTAALRGPTRNAPSTLPHWNIHEWELS